MHEMLSVLSLQLLSFHLRSTRLVTLRGMPLDVFSVVELFTAARHDSLYRINLLEPGMTEEAQARKAEEGMENVDHVSWPISNPTHLNILAMVSLLHRYH